MKDKISEEEFLKYASECDNYADLSEKTGMRIREVIEKLEELQKKYNLDSIVLPIKIKSPEAPQVEEKPKKETKRKKPEEVKIPEVPAEKEEIPEPQPPSIQPEKPRQVFLIQLKYFLIKNKKDLKGLILWRMEDNYFFYIDDLGIVYKEYIKEVEK